MKTSDILFLGILQGLTEFIPISSSGHLVIFQSFLGLYNVPILFDLILHLGTGTAVIIVYHREIGKILRDVFAIAMRKNLPAEGSEKHSLKLFFYLVISTGVTGTLGLLFRDMLENFFFKPLYVPLFLTITGVILLSTCFIKNRRREIAELHADYPIIIGAVQAFSMLPGISRSGATISASLFLGAARSFSSTYSFLLAIPSIFGASLVSFMISSSGAGNKLNVNAALIGYFISLLSGYAALKILLRLVKRGKLYVFSFYCFAFAIAAFILLSY
jgi:undecaprenyl-diphosphatase